MKSFHLIFAFGLAIGLNSLSAQTPVIFYPADSVRDHFDIAGKLDSKKVGLYKKLQERFGIKDKYSSDEVLAIEVPLVKTVVAFDIPQPKRGTKPVDALTAEQVENYFEVEKGSKAAAEVNMAILEKKYSKQSWYLLSEVRDVVTNGESPMPTMVPRNKTPLVEAAEQAVADGQVATPHVWSPFLIRKDWTDVIFDEDRSQDGIQSRTMGDLVGASLSYSNDRDGGIEAWNTVGSIIMPWLHEVSVHAGIMPENFGVTPSVSLNRLSTNGNPRNEVDQLLYRLGAFAEWYEILSGIELLQLRGAAVYGTDSGHHARMTGFEFDLEPRSLMGQSGGEEIWYKLGFRNTLWRKAPLLEDGSDQSLLDYQLRLWFHMEGGDIQNVSKTWSGVPESFLRMGPTAQLRFNMPHLWRGFSISAQYSNLETLQGPEGNNSLFKLDATLNLISDKSTGRKVSVNASYINGGMSFTKQDVDLMTIGMSLLF